MRCRAVLALCALSLALPMEAQQGRAPRVGVVLSGGGAKGIAHIGVLRVLESEGIYADIVTGTSMGALVGGLYAIGHTPASLDSLVTSLDWTTYFLDDPQRRWVSIDRRFVGDRTILDLALENWHVSLPSGFVRGQRVGELLARLTWSAQTRRDFTRLPRPFVAVATDIENGQPVVLDSGSLAQAMRASMSVPGVFDPITIGGHLLVDGGVTRNLPAMEARKLGADVLICSDVADPLLPASELKTLVDLLLQTMSIYVDALSEPDRELCDVLIRPSAKGLSAASFDVAAEWIARGDTAASAQRAKLREISARARGSTKVPPVGMRPVRVSSVDIVGIHGDFEDFARRRLNVSTPAPVTADQLEDAVQRLYATELFDRVTYRLDARGQGRADTVVVVTAEPKEQDQVGLGVRYDNAYNAALLLTARLRNRLGVGSTTQFDLRLGEQVRVAGEHVSVGIGGSRVAAGAGAAYNYSPLQLWASGKRLGEARLHVSSAQLFASVLRGGEAGVGVEVKGEHADVSTTVLGVESVRRQTYATGALLVRSNSLDRASFPSRGHMLSLRAEHAFATPDFEHYLGDVMIAVPVMSQLSLTGRATVGQTWPADVAPLHYTFMLGGVYPSVIFGETQVSMVGLRPQERPGATVTRVSAAAQWEPSRRVFVTLRGDAGRAGGKLTSDPDAYSVGVGLGLGALTPAGPVEMTGSIRPRGGHALLQLSLGYPF